MATPVRTALFPRRSTFSTICPTAKSAPLASRKGPPLPSTAACPSGLASCIFQYSTHMCVKGSRALIPCRHLHALVQAVELMTSLYSAAHSAYVHHFSFVTVAKRTCRAPHPSGLQPRQNRCQPEARRSADSDEDIRQGCERRNRHRGVLRRSGMRIPRGISMLSRSSADDSCHRAASPACSAPWVAPSAQPRVAYGLRLIPRPHASSRKNR